MNKSVRRLMAAAALLLVCGTARAEGVLAEIREEGEVRFGFRLDAPPFSYTDIDGTPHGLAVELCRVVARHLQSDLGLDNLTPKFVPVSAAERFGALVEGKTHVHCGPASATIGRRANIDFSIFYFIDGAGAVFRKGGPEAVEELDTSPVGVLRGTTTEKLVRENLHAEPPLLTLFDTHVDGIKALEAGDIEAYFADQAIISHILGQLRPRVPMIMTPEYLSFEPYALAMRRGETDLRLAVDTALSRIYASGEIWDIVDDELGDMELNELAIHVYDMVLLPE